MATVSEVVAFLRLKGGEQFNKEVKEKAGSLKDAFSSVQKILSSSGTSLFLRQAVQQLDLVKQGLLDDLEAANILKDLLNKGYNLDQAKAALNEYGKQFKKETGDMKSRWTQVKESFSSMNAALASAGAFLFLRNINEEANRATSAMLGLRSVAQFKGIEGAEQAVEQLDSVRAGLLGNFEAAQALKNLLSRGYNLEQAVQVINRLGEAASFGKAAHLSFGEAVVSATEGLRQENSILVDNAGVTKNVAKMWEDYAKSLGVSVTSLTQQQKVQAEINGIMSETQAQVGDLAKLSNSAAGEQARLAAQTTKASASLGQMVQTISAPFLTALASMVEAFNEAPRALQNWVIALGAVTVAVKLFGAALMTMLPMIGPGGWVLIALGALAGVFITLQSSSNRAKEAIEQFRQSLTSLTIDEAEKKLATLEERLKNFKLQVFAPAGPGGMATSNEREKIMLQNQIAELKKFVEEKRKLAAAAAQPAATALSSKELDEQKERLDNQRQFEFEHFQISRAQYIEYLQTRQKDFEKWSGDWTNLQEEILKQQGMLANENLANEKGIQAVATEIRHQAAKDRLKIVTEFNKQEADLNLEAQLRATADLEAMLEQQKAKAQEAANFMAQSISAITESIASAAVNGGNALKVFWKSILLTALEAIEKYVLLAKIKSIIEAVINPFSALKNIAPLAVAMGLLQVAKAKISAMAQGSVITQPTLALAGESLGAGNRFEVIAPERDFMSFSNELINRVLGQREASGNGQRADRRVNVTMNFNSPLTDERQAKRLTRAVLEPEVERSVRSKKRE